MVGALNAIDGLVTLDSCQHGALTDAGKAYVYFTYGSNWHELADLLDSLASGLREANLCCGFSLRLEWFGSNDRPRAQLALSPEHVADIAMGITAGLARFRHTYSSTDDT